MKNYDVWLRKRGFHPDQIKARKKKIGAPVWEYDLSVKKVTDTSDKIGNGTKSPDVSKSKFTEKNYVLAPAYSKGPIQVISKENLKFMGKKNI